MTNRRLEEEESTGDAAGDVGTGGLYELQNYNEFDSAVISLLFSVKEYDAASAEEKNTIN